MAALIVVARLALVVAGYVACGELVARRRSRSIADANEAFWAGAGIFSAAFVALSAIGLPVLGGVWIALGVMIVLAALHRFRRRVTASGLPDPAGMSRPQGRPAIFAAVLCAVAAAGFVWLDGRFGFVTDGFNIWVSRALAIHFDGRLLPMAQAPAFFSRFANYPPLVPLTEALVAGPGNPFNFGAAKAIFPVFLGSLLIGTYGLACRLLDSRRAAWTAAIVALLPAVSTDWNVGGFADLPLAAAVAAAAGAWIPRERKRSGDFTAAAWLAGSVMMIKAEGVIAVACMASVALLSVRFRTMRRRVEFVSILFGYALVLVLFHRRFGFPEGQYGPIDTRHVLLAAHRFLEVVGRCAAEASSLRHWGAFWWVVVASCAVFAARRSDPAAPLALLVVLAGAAFSSIFLFSNWGVSGAGIYATKSLGTHISLAYSRLLEQLVGPAAVVLVAAYSRLTGDGDSDRVPFPSVGSPSGRTDTAPGGVRPPASWRPFARSAGVARRSPRSSAVPDGQRNADRGEATANLPSLVRRHRFLTR